MARSTFSSKFALTLALGGGAVGCSVINTFDEVVPLSAGGAAGASGSGGAGGGTGGSGGASGSGASGGSAGATGGAAGSGGASGASGASGAAGAGGSAGTAGEGGLIVFGGKSGSADVLYAVSPANGAVLDTEPLLVRGAAYDQWTDRFYILHEVGGGYTFTSRAWDPVLEQWSTLASATGFPQPQLGTAFVVLKNRVAYLTQDSSFNQSLAVVNTGGATPSLVSIASPPAALATALDITGTPSTGGTTGGTINIGVPVCGDGGVGVACSAEVLPASLNATGLTTPIAQRAVGNYLTKFLLRSPQASNAYIVALLQGAVAGTPAQLHRLNPANLAPLGAPISTASSSDRLGGMAVDECQNVAIFSETTAATGAPQRLHVVPLDAAATAGSVDLTAAGQAVIYEPFTRTVLAPNQAGPLRAYTLGASGTPKAYTLTMRSGSDWQVPADARPAHVVVRRPNPAFTCPTPL